MKSQRESKSLLTVPVLLFSVATQTFLLATIFQPRALDAADQFELRIPGNDTVKTSAIIDEARLTLIDKRGDSFVYRRDQELDSVDYRAYWSDTALQFLRWPKSNRGNLQIGNRTGRSVSWRPSQMQVFPIEGSEPEKSDVEFQTSVHRISTLESPDRQEFAAFVDAAGKLQMHQFTKNRWQYVSEFSGAELGVGSGIAMEWNDELRQPSIYSIDQQGRLLSFDQGTLRTIQDDQKVRFSQGSAIAVSPRYSTGAIVDQTGRLWEVDLRSGDLRSIERRENTFSPDAQIALASSLADELFVIDKHGNMLNYARNARGWSAPSFVGKGLVPGGFVSAVAADDKSDTVYLATVDSQGIARVVSRVDQKWRSMVAPKHKFEPGSAITMRSVGQGLVMSGIDSKGEWHAFQNDLDDRGWTGSRVGVGFDPRIPVALRHRDAVALDRTGRFIVAESFHRNPRLALLSPRYRIAPYFRSRTIVENPPLAPARIVFNNSSDEELLVSIYNTTTDAKISEIKVPARGSSKQTLERYSGLTVEESLLIDDGFGNVRGESERYTVPAPNVYHVVVWVNRVTSVYFDRTKNAGPIPDSESRSLVSLGVIPLPAGPELSDGLNIDLIRIVKEQKNPGAAGAFKR